MRPQDLAWGIRASRFSLLVALVMLIGLAIAVAQRRERFITLRPQTWLLIILLVWVSLSVFNAIDPILALGRLELFAKVILISVVTTGLVRTYDRFRVLVVVVSFSLGLVAFKFGLFGLVRGGARFNRGPGGFMVDNNDFALALAVVLPLLYGLARVDRSRQVRLAAAVLGAFCIITIFFTFSRGGLLALAVVLFLLLVDSRRVLLGGSLLIMGIGALVVASSPEFLDSYVQRAQSIRSYEEDASAMGRIQQWKTAGRVIRDHPLFGVGPDNLRVVFFNYSDNTRKYTVTHNAFLQWAVEAGLPALMLFLALLIVTIWRMQILRARHHDPWVQTYARMLQISIVGYIVGSMFLDRAYYDLLYHLAGMSVSLEVAAEVAASVEGSVESSRSRNEAWWKRSSEAHPAAS